MGSAARGAAAGVRPVTERRFRKIFTRPDLNGVWGEVMCKIPGHLVSKKSEKSFINSNLCTFASFAFIPYLEKKIEMTGINTRM